jgi:hypothetical protein
MLLIAVTVLTNSITDKASIAKDSFKNFVKIMMSKIT